MRHVFLCANHFENQISVISAISAGPKLSLSAGNNIILCVTEDFVYPVDKHGREYGFGWSLLTTPEQLIGREACLTDRAPEDSYQRMVEHLAGLLPNATEKQIKKLLK